MASESLDPWTMISEAAVRSMRYELPIALDGTLTPEQMDLVLSDLHPTGLPLFKGQSRYELTCGGCKNRGHWPHDNACHTAGYKLARLRIGATPCPTEWKPARVSEAWPACEMLDAKETP